MSILSLAASFVRPNPNQGDTPIWQRVLQEAVRDMETLCQFLDLPNDLARVVDPTRDPFPLCVPRGYLARIHPGCPTDPLLIQVLPTAAERARVPGFSRDPVDDRAAIQVPGMLRKYAGRALLIVSEACAVHCRFCFRRHFPYRLDPIPNASPSFRSQLPSPAGAADHPFRQGPPSFQPALDALAADRTIREVIFSGGDPLTCVDPVLADLANSLARIEHIDRLRIHTRFPVMIPERVTESLLAWLTGTRLVPIVVIHVNHAREIDAPVAAAIGRLVDGGVPVLNQAVLLAGVNDSIATQQELCERLIQIRVIPYYLHLLDPVAGAAHFQVPEEWARSLIESLRAQLPGYAVPRLVREVAGANAKVVVA